MTEPVGWLLDPETREPLPAYPDKTPEIAYRARHWRPGWLTGVERENGVPVRVWYRQCQDECCADYRANLAPLENLRRCKCHPIEGYLTCERCPKCKNWSFDPLAGACERRKCGYVEPENP